MPVIALRTFLQNNSGFALTKTFDHLCGGVFTPGLPPPDSIPTGGTARLAVRVRWLRDRD